MSENGQKRTSDRRPLMSALPHRLSAPILSLFDPVGATQANGSNTATDGTLDGDFCRRRPSSLTRCNNRALQPDFNLVCFIFVTPHLIRPYARASKQNKSCRSPHVSR